MSLECKSNAERLSLIPMMVKERRESKSKLHAEPMGGPSMKNQKSGSSYLNYCFIWDWFCCPRGVSGARSRAWQGMVAASGRSGDQSSRRRAADGRTRIESKCIMSMGGIHHD